MSVSWGICRFQRQNCGSQSQWIENASSIKTINWHRKTQAVCGYIHLYKKKQTFTLYWSQFTKFVKIKNYRTNMRQLHKLHIQTPMHVCKLPNQLIYHKILPLMLPCLSMPTICCYNLQSTQNYDNFLHQLNCISAKKTLKDKFQEPRPIYIIPACMLQIYENNSSAWTQSEFQL